MCLKEIQRNHQFAYLLTEFDTCVYSRYVISLEPMRFVEMGTARGNKRPSAVLLTVELHYELVKSEGTLMA